MCEMKDLKIKLNILSEFLFTIKVNGEEREVDSETNTVTFTLPEDADYEVEIAQKQPISNHKLIRILWYIFTSIFFVIFVIFFQDGSVDEWIGDIQPFLLRAKIRGNMREHSELNLYYHRCKNINGDYTKPRLVCDEIEPCEVSYEPNSMDIKNKFHSFARVVITNALMVLVLLMIMLISGLVSPVNIVLVSASSMFIAATIALCTFVLILKHRKWYKYLHTN